MKSLFQPLLWGTDYIRLKLLCAQSFRFCKEILNKECLLCVAEIGLEDISHPLPHIKFSHHLRAPSRPLRPLFHPPSTPLPLPPHHFPSPWLLPPPPPSPSPIPFPSPSFPPSPQQKETTRNTHKVGGALNISATFQRHASFQNTLLWDSGLTLHVLLFWIALLFALQVVPRLFVHFPFFLRISSPCPPAEARR